jgi:DNA-binding CsgD family transcriptional regulator
VAAGLTSKEIARRLTISPLTVRKHRENSMRRLGVHNMAELIDAVRALGISDTPSEVFQADEE